MADPTSDEQLEPETDMSTLTFELPTAQAREVGVAAAISGMSRRAWLAQLALDAARVINEEHARTTLLAVASSGVADVASD